MHNLWIMGEKKWFGIAVVAGILVSATTGQQSRAQSGGDTATRIKHVVVIFQENVSFDHYFATYPQATNPSGEPAFHTRSGTLFQTPSVNGLTGALLTIRTGSIPSGSVAARITPAIRTTITGTSRKRLTLDSWIASRPR